MPVTHDSMRLIDQAKAICEQRIYLDEAKELYSLISSKWMRVGQYQCMTNFTGLRICKILPQDDFGFFLVFIFFTYDILMEHFTHLSK